MTPRSDSCPAAGRRAWHGWFVLAVLVVIVSGCASTGTAERRNRPNPNLLTAIELENTETSNVYDAVRRLRPRWLTAERSRERTSMSLSSQTVVFLNSTRLGSVDALRDVPLSGVKRVEFMDGAEATAKLPGLGSGHVTGAIIVHTY